LKLRHPSLLPQCSPLLQIPFWIIPFSLIGENYWGEIRKSDPEQFRFSVLQILPKTMARDEVLQRETLYKHKLGTRAKGLNSN
jgi:hypothetical protein